MSTYDEALLAQEIRNQRKKAAKAFLIADDDTLIIEVQRYRDLNDEYTALTKPQPMTSMVG